MALCSARDILRSPSRHAHHTPTPRNRVLAGVDGAAPTCSGSTAGSGLIPPPAEISTLEGLPRSSLPTGSEKGPDGALSPAVEARGVTVVWRKPRDHWILVAAFGFHCQDIGITKVSSTLSPWALAILMVWLCLDFLFSVDRVGGTENRCLASRHGETRAAGRMVLLLRYIASNIASIT